jgi:hypothetical protein
MKKHNSCRQTCLRFNFSTLTFIFIGFVSLFVWVPLSFSAGVTLGWDPNTEPDLTGYKIYYKTVSSGPTYDGTDAEQGPSAIYLSLDSFASPDSPSYTLTGLQEGQTYYFAVTAVGSAGNESVYSNEVSHEFSQTAFTYTIASSSGSNGSITPSGDLSIAEGATQTYTVSPDANYHVKDVQVDGISVGQVFEYTFSNITSDHSIYASFEADPPITYLITASAGPNGSISPTSAKVNAGDSQSFTIIPDSGYHVEDVLVDGISVGAVTAYTFSALDADHTISASFAVDTFSIQASASSGGVISPSGAVSVSYGGSQSFTITPDSGYHVEDVLVDGVSVGSLSSYTFDQVVEDHTISASFAMDNQAPIADAGPDQSVESGSVVNLVGSNSIDLDDGIASFTWEQISGPMVELLVDPAEPANASFVSPDVSTDGESLVFELTVTDTEGLQSVDSCIINVSWVNMPPVADAGSDQMADEGTTVILDGSKSVDTDDGIVSYLWEQLDGVPVSLSDATAVQPTLLAPDVSIDGISLSFQLTVTDSGGLQSVDTCIVNVSWVNMPPIADAGPDQTLDAGMTANLDGSGSSDADDGIVMYLWKQLSGIPVTLSDTTAINPTFTAPDGITTAEPLLFSLTVTDSGGLESSDSSEIMVEPVIAPQLSTITISSISMGLDKTGRNYKAIVYASVVDGAGNPLVDASVTGNWFLNGQYLNSIADLSTNEGWVRLVSKPVKVKSGDVFSISIVDAVKDGFVYEPNMDSESIAVP